VDSLLTDDQRIVRDAVRKWVDERLLPLLPECADRARFPTELIAEIAQLGVLGSSLQGYGCAGLDGTAYGLVMQELERGDSGIRSFASVQSALVMYPIHSFGSEEQKDQYLPPMARGEIIGCFGLTEPDFGSNPAGMRTRAVRDGNGWRINGAKMWITNGSMADVSVVWAKTEGDDPKGIRGFLVEKDAEGFSAPEQKRKFSLRVSVTSELILEDVWVGDDALLPGTEMGLRAALMCLTQARYGIAWGALGAAAACFDEALRYTGSRTQFSGRPLASHQLVQSELADMVTDITLGQLLALRLSQLHDEGRMTPTQVSMAKRYNVRMALETARRCRDLLGASGITYEYQVGRHLTNLESVVTYEGTHNIHTLAIGKELTGIPAFE
jgi:glutaryl-CoA dehydrogenase